MREPRLSRETRTRWILDMLREHGPMSPAEIAEQLSVTVDHARVVLRQMRASGAVRSLPGQWEPGMRGRPPMYYKVQA